MVVLAWLGLEVLRRSIDPDTHGEPVELALESPVVDGVEVLVRLAADPTPIPGADVLYLDEEAFKPRAPDMPDLERDVDQIMASEGRRFRTDEHGIARVPPSPHGARLAAASPGLWGMGFVDPRYPGRAVVRVLKDVSLPVLVLDGASRPVADASIWLWVSGEHLGYVARHARSAVDGRATLTHVQLPFDHAPEGRFIVMLEPTEEREMRVTRAHGVEIEHARLSGDPGAPIVLVVPTAGASEGR